MFLLQDPFSTPTEEAEERARLAEVEKRAASAALSLGH